MYYNFVYFLKNIYICSLYKPISLLAFSSIHLALSKLVKQYDGKRIKVNKKYFLNKLGLSCAKLSSSWGYLSQLWLLKHLRSSCICQKNEVIFPVLTMWGCLPFTRKKVLFDFPKKWGHLPFTKNEVVFQFEIFL